jgi:hypothetical protein
MSRAILPPESKTIGLSTKGRRKPQTLLAAARHNLREIQKELGAGGHIDATRIHLNNIMAGPDTAAAVVALAAQMMEDVGYKPARKDYVQAHELMFTLSRHTPVCAADYFAWCFEFIQGRFGNGSILSAVIHKDEAEDHLHILVAPIAAGVYVGSSLITKPSWAELVDDYAVEVLAAFGLEAIKKLGGAMRKLVGQAVHKGLRAALEGRIEADLMNVLLKLADAKPTALMEPLGITLSGLNEQAGDNGAAFKRIALSTGKGGKKERHLKPYGFEVAEFEGNQKPYGFEADPITDSEPAPEKDRNHTCVVSTEKTRPQPTTTPPFQTSSRMKATKPPARVEPISWADYHQRRPDHSSDDQHDSDLDHQHDDASTNDRASTSTDSDGTTRTRCRHTACDDEGSAAWQTV